MIRLAAAALAGSVFSAALPPPSGAPDPTLAEGDRVTSNEGRHIERLLDEWRFHEAETALAALAQALPGETEVVYLQGYARYLAGDYPGATAKLHTAVSRLPGSRELKSLLALAGAADAAIKGHREARSQHFVIRFPPEDEVLADFALESLEAALAALRDVLGFTPDRPIIVDIYRSPSDLASVSTLTEEEVQRTGTIALCKWARLMATTPRALRLGYPWQDSLAHELVHYVVSSLSRDHAPVWLQEGLAKFLEHRWRAPDGDDLPPAMQHVLARALAARKLIGFDAMHPSMAKLPSAEDASLAFAEVATAIAALHAHGGTAALRAAIGLVRDGIDARTAVAAANGGNWSTFEKSWRAYMAAKKYKTIPGMDPVTTKFRKPSAMASRRGPSEDEETLQTGIAKKYLRLGNMMLLRRRLKAASLEYEKGIKQSGPSHWLFSVKLGRTYLALGQAENALRAVGDARTLYPDLPWPHLIAGQAELAQGHADKALGALKESLAANPFDPAVHCAMAEVYQKLPVTPAWPAAHRERAERYCRELAQ